jgi:hypothetical protein
LIDVVAPNIAYISQTKLQLLSRREPPVDLKQDPVLTIWEARNLLAEIAVFPETDEISKMVAETERDLVNLILRILALRKMRDQPRLRLVSRSDDLEP